MNKKKINMDYLNLKGKTVFITGATGYFGNNLSIAMAKKGAKVILNGRNLKKLKKLNTKLKKLKLKSEIANFDINDFKRLEFNTKKIKKLDVLIHNAYDSSINYSDKSLNVNNKNSSSSFMLSFFSVNNLNKIFFKKMKKSRNSTSSIINISSIYGSRSPDFSIYEKKQKPSPEFYGAGKAALSQLTKYYAVKYAPFKIRVNAISPGAFPNILTQKKFPNFKKNILKKIPLKRLGIPEDLVVAVLFLASDSSSYITGINLGVDGGWSAW